MFGKSCHGHVRRDIVVKISLNFETGLHIELLNKPYGDGRGPENRNGVWSNNGNCCGKLGVPYLII